MKKMNIWRTKIENVRMMGSEKKRKQKENKMRKKTMNWLGIKE